MDLMDCAHSVELLSDFHEGTLNDVQVTQVRLHLAECPPCADVLQDITVIVGIAVVMRSGDAESMSFPDETVLWERISLSRQASH